MSSGGVQTGHHSIVRENFSLESTGVISIAPSSEVLLAPSSGVLLAGPTRSGTTMVVKSFSRVINASGTERTVTFYMVPTGGSATDANSIGKAMVLPAAQWMPFGEHYLPYGYSIYGSASGWGVQIVFSYLLED